MKAGLAAFGVGAAILLVFAKGDESMERVGAIVLFVGGITVLVGALIDRRQRRRPPPRV